MGQSRSRSPLKNTLLSAVKMTKYTCCVLMFLTWMQGTLGERGEESFMTRIKRAACDPQKAESCAKDAINTYTSALFQSNGQPESAPAGAKPDYQERKTCNFLLDTEKCFSKLETCDLPADQLKAMKDEAFKKARDGANKLPNWDDAKCQSADPNTPK